MSKSDLLKSAAVIILGGVMGYSGVHTFKSTSPGRFIASKPLAKLGLEQSARSFFEVRVETEVAATDSDVSVIKVTVQAISSLPVGLNYSWHLPGDVTLVEGTLQDQMGAFSSGEVRQYTLKIKNFSKEQIRYLSFEVQGSVNSIPLRHNVMVSSRIEDSFEYQLQQAGKHSATGQNNKLDTLKTKFSSENVVR